VIVKLITDLKKYFAFSVDMAVRVYVTANHILVMDDEFGNIFKGTAVICNDSIPKFACME